MTQLRERFQGDSAVVNRSLLLPKMCNRASFIEIEELPQPYSSFLPKRACHGHCFRNRTVALEILLAASRFGHVSNVGHLHY